MIFIGSTPKLNGIDSPNIRDSFQPVSQALRDMGEELTSFVRVPGTWDVDWAALAAAARPATNSPYPNMGDTFRFDDALQAEAPIYFRFEYGHGSTNTPAMFIRVGTGVDPVTGDLTGNVSPARIMMNPSVAQNGPFPIWLAGGKNFITLVVVGTAGVTAGTLTCIIERTRDHNGLETPDGAILLAGGNGSPRVALIPQQGSVGAEVTASQHLTSVGTMAGLSSSGTDLVMAPVSVPHNGLWRYATALTYKHTDIAHGSIFDLDHLGDERQYIALGADRTNVFWGAVSGSTGLAVRWE